MHIGRFLLIYKVVSKCIELADEYNNWSLDVPVLLVDQELSSTGVPVLDALCEPDSVGKDSITSLDWEILCWGNLNDLLVTTLDTAVTLVEMDDIALVVTKKLDFNVLGLVEEALDEDGSVTESRLGF